MILSATQVEHVVCGMIKFAAALCLVLAIGTPASARDLTKAEKQAIADAVKEILRDPESAQFKWVPMDETPRSNWVPVDEPGAHWALYCGWVNAKNGFGGYNGFEPFSIVLISQGRSFVPRPGDVMISGVHFTPADIAADCRKHGYLQFRM